MFGSAILDTAIGMAFVFLLLSLICGIIQEIIATAVSWRAKTLKDGIQQLLSDPNFSGLAKKLYDHALIKPMMKAGKDPSYISSRTFALALLDMMDPSAANKAAASAQAFVAGLPNGQLKTIATALVSDATMKVEHLRQNIEDWFDDAMDRVSGWYKRRAQIVTLAVGLVVCVGFNVDALAIFSTMWKDPTVRESVVKQAASFAAAKPNEPAKSTSVAELQSQLGSLALPIGWKPAAESKTELDRKSVV